VSFLQDVDHDVVTMNVVMMNVVVVAEVDVVVAEVVAVDVMFLMVVEMVLFLQMCSNHVVLGHSMQFVAHSCLCT
jgi:hypothetical protein